MDKLFRIYKSEHRAKTSNIPKMEKGSLAQLGYSLFILASMPNQAPACFSV